MLKDVSDSSGTKVVYFLFAKERVALETSFTCFLFTTDPALEPIRHAELNSE